ncbi:MAG TPA: DUF503 domain-containing protein [Deltaproteobacteria bacterium]|nr:MAG: hypothetical protein A2X88_01850 [Deltaproteobacteria bacterium GWC2_65_14]HBO69722.1 DUF503 domain-containing protein [Deltaproteobacteria bacterium]
MLVAVLVAELRIPDALSLKDKRRRMSALTGRIRAKFPVSVAEVGCRDLLQRGRIGVALVTTDARLAQSMLDRITDILGGDGEVEMTDRTIEILRIDDEAR